MKNHTIIGITPDNTALECSCGESMMLLITELEKARTAAKRQDILLDRHSEHRKAREKKETKK